MVKLSQFWKLFETRNDRTAVLAEWQQRAGGAFEAIYPLLVPTGSHAESYPHPKPYGLPLRVVKHRDNSLVAICSEDSEIRIPLTKRDIALYRIDMEKLRKCLADLLSLSAARGPIDQRCDSMLVGKYKPKVSADFPVHLVIAKQRSFATIIKDLCESEKPFILLTTSSAYCTEDIVQRLDKQKAVLVLMDDVITNCDGHLQCTDQWPQYLSAFAQHVNPTSRSNFSNKPSKKGQKTAANAMKLRKWLEQYIRDQYDRIHSESKQGIEPAEVPKLQKKQIGEAVGLKPDQVTRASKKEPFIKKLLMIASSNDTIREFWKHV